MRRIISFLVIVHFLWTFQLSAQITKHGDLNSKKNPLLKQFSEIPIINMPNFNIQQLLDEDKRDEKNSNKPFRFAKTFDVNIDVKKDGLLEEMVGTGKIWRLRIKSSGAYSLNFIFGVYELPTNAELFIYNKDQTQMIGALTETNNNPSKVVPVQPLKGDEVIIEYFEPKEIPFSGRLIITKIGHDYKGFFNALNEYDGRFRTSQSCNVDINCADGNNWQNEKHAVCRLLINASGYCTGSLINNVNNDGTAYVLTANHCISSSTDANNNANQG